MYYGKSFDKHYAKKVILFAKNILSQTKS